MTSFRGFSLFMLLLLLRVIGAASIQKGKIQFDIITDITRSFKIGRLNVLCNDTVKISKRIMGSNVMIRSSYATTPQESVLFCALENENALSTFKQLLGQHYQNAVLSKWFVIGSRKTINDIVNESTVDINKIILFMNSDTEILEEIYHVNQKTVRKGLLVGANKTNVVQDPSKYSRIDFKGLILKGAMTNWKPLIYYHQETWPQVKWKKDKNGVLYTKVPDEKAFGTFTDILRILEKDLNFTLNKYIWKRNRVGFHKIVNGTFAGWTGHIGALLDGKLQVLASPNVYTPDKHGVLSFMHMMDTLTLGLLVSVTAGIENLEWFTYLLPFKLYLWVVLICSCIWVLIVAQACQVLMTYQDKENLTHSRYFNSCTTVILLYMGLPTWTSKKDTGTQLQKLLRKFGTILLFGSFIFIAYKSALTSKLSIQRYFLPFTTMEEFYHSDFTLVYNWNPMERYLRQYKNYKHIQWVTKQFYEQDQVGYVRRYETALKEVVVPYSQKAFFSYLEKSRMYPDLKCQIAVVWKLRFPSPMAMAMGVQSPYFHIINNVWLKKIESGIRSRIMDRGYGSREVNCQNGPRQKPLGFSTVSGLLVVLFIGMLLSIFIALVEAAVKLVKRENKIANDFEVFEDEMEAFCRKYCPTFNENDYIDFKSELSLLLDSCFEGFLFDSTFYT